ncbi:zf-HC2 domain-containing protein [Methylobacterium sp. 190mf]|uniref:zf-HC2 domain-containing protein n=1 Tax=Methylobacterium sp. 190mf TaxID=1761798 RepID=UPI00036615E9|nr:zf-HC2 domain-containing protein [Methylobacterium sp. 190mf]
MAEQASAFVDAEVSGYVRWRIRLHLATCKNCLRFVRQIALTRDALGRLPHPPLDATREDELVAALREASR